MRSGKSTELLRLLRRIVAAGQKYLAVTYKKDNRFSGDTEAIGTHDNQQFPARKLESLDQLSLGEIEAVQYIVIDEAQFFHSVNTYAERWFLQGKHVILGALNSTWERKPFDNISPLYALTTGITYLTAICVVCGHDAPYSKRIAGGTELIEIGSESYQSVCAECY